MGAFSAMFPATVPMIGVIHLPPLPGFAGSPGTDRLVQRALADAQVLAEAGADGVLVENEYDRPHEVASSARTVAVVTRIVTEVVRTVTRVPIGVELLLNDPCASIAVARASGASFIRTDYFVDRMSRPEHGGAMAIDPVGLLRYRESLGADHVLILADVQVKYAVMLEPRPVGASARDAHVHGADAVVVTGSRTGSEPTGADLEGPHVRVPRQRPCWSAVASARTTPPSSCEWPTAPSSGRACKEKKASIVVPSFGSCEPSPSLPRDPESPVRRAPDSGPDR